MPGQQANTPTARSHALAVLRIRGSALSIALLPAAAAVILHAGGVTGQLGSAWDGLRWTVTVVAVLTLAVAAVVAIVIARARPAITPTVPVAQAAAPDLYALVRELAQRLDVPVPSAIALTPDCDSWLEDRTHPAHGADDESGDAGRDESGHAGRDAGARRRRRVRRGAEPEAPVLVIGSPFLWWMRVAELRALLAPVVAGTGPSAHPDIAAARRCVRSLDAAVAAADHARMAASVPGAAGQRRGAVRRVVLRFTGWIARLMLRSCGPHTSEMERGVAAAAADRAKGTDKRLRVTAQEQVGLAYAGWDRLLTRVALPAWRAGRWPSRLDAGVVSALTELSRRDRLAEDFSSRLGERPACDLLEEPGSMDESISLLAARLFHGEPRGHGTDGTEWAPVDWAAYPEEVVDRIWRAEASRLFDALDATEAAEAAVLGGGTAKTAAPGAPGAYAPDARQIRGSRADAHAGANGADPSADTSAAAAQERERQPERTRGGPPYGVTLSRIIDRLTRPAADAGTDAHRGDGNPDGAGDPDGADEPDADVATGHGDAIAARISATVAREELARGAVPGTGTAAGDPLQPVDGLPQPMGLPLEPPRSGRELLAEHIAAAVCCAAVDTAGAAPGLDWLDGPVLLVDGERSADLTRPVLALVEDGDAQPLRGWLARAGVRPDKPVRLI
ncbi:hypothetical protein DVA86_21520 [Streptomyces armeniacus]|uniref:Uncharacterized protein n=1 Tax=Streptomyces armeniacus TaxID=83291 RepID=A0A345XT74_9ACTN|nr:hypothetical protein [Streptomyces armeniacus]AXK34840.1 hypothetical protein DVA86_21520 [Streptomyces armeniacus]